MGRVENPADLGDRFALVTPSRIEQAERISLLVDADQEQIDAFISGIPGGVAVGDRGEDTATTAAVVTLGMSTVVLLLVSPDRRRRVRGGGPAAAAPARDARRDRRHREARAAGDGGQRRRRRRGGRRGGHGSRARQLDRARRARGGGHRAPGRSRRPALVAGRGGHGARGAHGAPRRRGGRRAPSPASRSSRPCRPGRRGPTRRTARSSSRWSWSSPGSPASRPGIDTSDGSAQPLLVVGGVLATVLGMLLLSPAAVSLLPPSPGGCRSRPAGAARPGAQPGPLRCGCCRHQPGSGHRGDGGGHRQRSRVHPRQDAGPGNLADDQLVLSIGNPRDVVPERTPAEIERMDSRVDELAGALGDATVVPLDSAIDPSASLAPVPAESEDTGGRPSGVLAGRPAPAPTRGVRSTWPRPSCWPGRASIRTTSIPASTAVTSLTGELVWIPEFADQKGERPNRNRPWTPAHRPAGLPLVAERSRHTGGPRAPGARRRPGPAGWSRPTGRSPTTRSTRPARRRPAPGCSSRSARPQSTATSCARSPPPSACWSPSASWR